MPNPAAIAVATVALADVREASWPQLSRLLSEEERGRAARFHFERNRREYVAAHALKRLMLCEAAGRAPDDWTFTVEPLGKPLVAGGQGPHFNLSHCNGLVACALSFAVPLGVDVEPVDRHAPLDVAERYFAAEELTWLFSLAEVQRPLGFFKLWTMKEAFIKATGKGVSQGLDTFVMGFDPLRVTFPDPSKTESGPWRFAQEAVGNTHLLGVAWRGPAAEVIVRSVRLEELAGVLAPTLARF